MWAMTFIRQRLAADTDRPVRLALVRQGSVLLLMPWPRLSDLIPVDH
jgi:hypothetical protein